MSLIEGHWLATKDGDRAAYALYRRHYSAKKNRRPKIRQFVGPGDKLVYVTSDYRALFVWRKFIDDSGQVGLNCAVFRNESGILSSELILEAERLAWNIYPGIRLYTYVDQSEIEVIKVHSKPSPGFCFIKAGWRYVGHIEYNKDCEECQKKKRACGTTKKGLIILEKIP